MNADRHLKNSPSRCPPAYAMRALGHDELPNELRVAGVHYTLEQTVKHDFFAATGFYRDDAGHRVVMKVGRTEPFAGLPLQWLGRWLASREMCFYRALADVPNVPRLIGSVGPTGFVHAYVPGRPLARDEGVPDRFFDELLHLMRELHRRGIAYVDANKPQNILVGADGRPYLIDFQISCGGAIGGWPTRWWLRWLQREDLYHVLKHKRRLRPDLLTKEERLAATRRSPLIRLHRCVAWPYFRLRRATFGRLRATGRLLPEGSK